MAERSVAVARQDLEDTVIRAPFAGVAISKDAQPGEMISPVSAGGGFTRTGICTWSTCRRSRSRWTSTRPTSSACSPAQQVEATLDAYPDWRIPAHVITTIPAADRQKATVKVRIGFDAARSAHAPRHGRQGRLPGRAVAQDSTATAPRRPVAIPRVALDGPSGSEVVWVVAGDRAERRAVTVGRINGEEARSPPA